jgi:Uma2 family endonuclease
MTQQASTRSSSSFRNRTKVERPDPFRFGWRYVRNPGANGASESERVPLTPEDLLHPQEGDEIPENTIQERDRTYLASVLRLQLADRPHVVILSDCLVNWGVKGLGKHSPDVSVFDNVADPEKNWRTFPVRKEQARPVLIIEIVSVDRYDRKVRDNDVVIKVKEYYRAGVPLYVIVDREEEEGPRWLLGYRFGPRRYVPLPLDEQGRLLLEPVKLLLGMRDNRVVCFDAVTGQEIGDLTSQVRARLAAESALAEAQARIRELEQKALRRARGRTPRSREP